MNKKNEILIFFSWKGDFARTMLFLSKSIVSEVQRIPKSMKNQSKNNAKWVVEKWVHIGKLIKNGAKMEPESSQNGTKWELKFDWKTGWTFGLAASRQMAQDRGTGAPGVRRGARGVRAGGSGPELCRSERWTRLHSRPPGPTHAHPTN